MKNSRLIGIGAMLTVFFLLAGGLAMAETMKIGVISSFKTPSGEDLLNGAKIATEEINAQGGIMGQKIELVPANDEYKPEKGVMAWKKLVLEDKCNVIFGTTSSGVAKAVMDQMVRFPAMFISTGAASEALAELLSQDPTKYKFWFRVMHQSGDLSLGVHDYIYNLPVKKMGAKRMAIMAENALWTRGMVKDAEKFFKDKGLEIVYSEFFDTETKDFTPIFTKIINAKAEFIYEISAHVDGAIYIKQWYDLKGPMIGGVSGTGASDRYWKDCDSKAVGETLIAMGSYRVALTPQSIPFFDRYVAKFKVSPGYPTGYTYDAFHIYKIAVEKAKSTKPEAVAPLMEKTDYVGVAGRYVFDETHNAKYGEAYRQLPMVQWRKDGSRAVVWPKNLATGEYELPPWVKK
jgi:branched-chain amino acid transport system substrate-binding protein